MRDFLYLVIGLTFLTRVSYSEELPTRTDSQKHHRVDAVMQGTFVQQNQDVVMKKNILFKEGPSQKVPQEDTQVAAEEQKQPKAPAQNPSLRIDGDTNRNGELDPGERWKIESSNKRWRSIYEDHGEHKIDVNNWFDKYLSLADVGRLMRGEEIKIGKHTIKLKTSTKVVQAVEQEQTIPKAPAGAVGVGGYQGSPVGGFGSRGNGFFNDGSGTVGKTKEGAVTVNAKLNGKSWASWGFDFKNPVNVEDKILVVNLKGPVGSQIFLHWRDQKWHEAGKFNTVQAFSNPITFTGDWQEVRIDLSLVAKRNGIDFSQLKHIAIEFGGNQPGMTFQVGDTSKNLPGFLFEDKDKE